MNQMTSRAVVWCVLLISSAAVKATAADDLDFLTGLTQSTHLETMTFDALKAEAMARLEARAREVAKISTRADFDRRHAFVRARLRELIGEFPARTPLNARVVGQIDRGEYRIEKVIFESRPRFFVTANLYVPQGVAGPMPAVLVPLGHELGGKSNPTWQRLITTLARKGYVVLTWDPLGQGERVQLWDEDLKDSKPRGGSTVEHTILHSQSLLLGETLARSLIFDGMRALDYLLSRPEVDAKRVAVTGNSGGGTGTTYLSATEDRFAAAAPSCYITSWKALLNTIGPQDGEQVITGFLGAGLDFPDFLYAALPTPFLILSAIRDFFPISGARATYAEVRATAERVGLGDAIGMKDADDGHGYSRPRRDAFYAWADAKFHPARANVVESEEGLLRAEDLNCTSTGQVATSMAGAVAIPDLNRKRFLELKSKRPALTVEKLRELVGIQAGERTTPVVARYGVVAKSGYRVEKFTVETDPGVVLPGVVLVPEGGRAKKPVVLYASGSGKSADPGYAELLAKDVAVVAVDLRGFGETAAKRTGDAWSRYLGDYNSIMTAVLLGKNLVGLRVKDLVCVLDAMKQFPALDVTAISGRASGAAVVPMLHAAALDARIRALTVDDGLVSYESVLMQRIPYRVLEEIVPGAARFYDLRDLVSMMGRRPVWVVRAHDAAGAMVPTAELARVYGGIAAVASGCGSGVPQGQLPATEWCTVREGR